MRKRIFAVLGILLVFRILAHIPVPISDPQTIQQVLSNALNGSNSPQFLNVLNVFSGGALEQFSIMVVGLGAYINASIIMQLLTKAIPRLETLHKEGEFGQKKINQMTRLLTFPLAIVQAIGAVYLIRQIASGIGGVGDITADATLAQWVLMVAAITGGSMLLMWLGELITERSIGNGISLLITVSIVSSLPSTVASLGGAIINQDRNFNFFGASLPLDGKALALALGIFVAVIIVTWLVVKLNEAARNITVNYAKRVQGNRAYGGVTTTLPVKLITAGVIPIIFAVAFLSVPTFAGQLFSKASNPQVREMAINATTWFQPPSSAQAFADGGLQSYIYPVTYFLLVFVFTYFYTSITFNSKEIAENLQKQGGFIEGIRTGATTEKYLGKIVNRLTFFGALSLGLLALLPIIAQMFLTASIALGGTSVLILVSVALQTLRSLESRALMVTYDQYSRSDFFYEPDTALEAATGAQRLKFLRRLKPGKKDR